MAEGQILIELLVLDITTYNEFCPVGWGCRIHRLLLSRGLRPPPNECPWYDIK